MSVFDERITLEHDMKLKKVDFTLYCRFEGSILGAKRKMNVSRLNVLNLLWHYFLQTFIVICKERLIHRFDADPACYLLSPFNCLRSSAIKILLHPYPKPEPSRDLRLVFCLFWLLCVFILLLNVQMLLAGFALARVFQLLSVFVCYLMWWFCVVFFFLTWFCVFCVDYLWICGLCVFYFFLFMSFLS